MRQNFGGAELEAAALDNLTIAGTVNINTTTKRSGNAAFDHPGSDSRCIHAHTNATGVWFYARVWIYFSANPAVAVRVATWSTSTNYQGGVVLGTDGKITGSDGTISGSAYAPGWHCIEIGLKFNTVNDWRIKSRVDGLDLGGEVLKNPSVTPDRFNFGNTNAVAHGITLLSDDWAINDDTGAAQNSWPGITEKIILSLPTADNAVGADWKLGDTTSPSSNAYDSVNNMPPVGVADAGAPAGAQIRDAVANITDPAAAADFTCQSYTTAGVPSGGTVTATKAIAAVGLSSGGTARAVGMKIVSNPADSAEVNTNTPTAGISTYPSGWGFAQGAVTSAPSVTNGTAPVVRIGKRTSTASTRVVSAVGVYFGYEPASGPTPPTSGQLWPRGWKDTAAPASGQLFPRRVIT